MSAVTRQEIYDNLFNLGSTVQWGSPLRGFVRSSQRATDFADCPEQAAFFQVAHDEEFVQVTGMPYRVQLTAKWLVYYRTAADPSVVGSVEGNLIMDAFEGALVPKIVPGRPYVDRCTLGGLVYHAYIGGTVFRDGGDVDGQGVIVVPIQILVP